MSHLAGHVAKLNSKSREIDSLDGVAGEGFDAIFTIYYRTLGCCEGCRLERKEERVWRRGRVKMIFVYFKAFPGTAPNLG